VRVSYHPGYVIPLPPRHSFPMPKFAALRDLLVDDGVIKPHEIVEPDEAAWADLGLVHCDTYLAGLASGSLGEQAQKRMGFPWTPALVTRSRLAVTGTVNAAEMALADGIAGNLAGGTHHAMPDRGEGFCVLNDVAIAIHLLLDAGRIERALVIDLDVHQGNGTAAIFENEPRVYTFSMHGEKNFPIRKETSTRDVPLPDRMTDADYLDTLARHLPEVLDEANADLVFYLGGVDVLHDDKFGRLSLTMDGLEARDRMAVEDVTERGTPLCLLLSGGYAPTPEETARRHAVMYRVATEVARATV
jgi:acetoin utilization deacetylase AcuC-like enzyme